MANLALIKTTIATVVFVASLGVNVPVIVVTTRSKKLMVDIISRVKCSLAVSDLCLGSSVVAASAVVAWTIADVEKESGGGSVHSAVATFFGFIYDRYTISTLLHLAFASVIKCCVITQPLTYFAIFTDRVVTRTLVAI